MRNVLLSFSLLTIVATAQPKFSPEKEASVKADLIGQIDAMKKQAQVMVDSVFSFGELGFHGRLLWPVAFAPPATIGYESGAFIGDRPSA